MTIVFAHRGAPHAAPENTVPAFRAARELGADWVELDVRRTADDVLVVHHDARLPDGRLLVDLTAAELPSGLPTLAEALEACEGMGVNIEIKNLPGDPDYDSEHQISGAVAGLVAAYRSYDEVLVSSFNRDVVARIRAIDPAIPTGLLTVDLPSPAQAIEWIVAGGHGALHPYVALVDAALVDRAHQAGLAVHVWTVNDPDRIAELVGMGVDGVVTDHPDVARRVVDAHRAS